MSDWAEKAMRGELGDSHYGRDPAEDFSEEESPRYVRWKGVCGHEWNVRNIDWSASPTPPPCPACACLDLAAAPSPLRDSLVSAVGQLANRFPLTPPADAPSKAEPIVVTDEMIAAGLAADEALPDKLSEQRYFSTIYRAMAAVAPTDEPLYEEVAVPDPMLALIAERDAALARAQVAEKERDGWMVEWDREHKFQQARWLPRNRELEAKLAAAEQRLAALEPKPEPPHDWTREFTGDRRRVGG